MKPGEHDTVHDPGIQESTLRNIRNTAGKLKINVSKCYWNRNYSKNILLPIEANLKDTSYGEIMFDFCNYILLQVFGTAVS